MISIKKATTFLFAFIVPASLIVGYFCSAMPMAPTAQAMEMLPMNDLSACGETDATVHFMASSDASHSAVALCCLAKEENSKAGFLILTAWSPNDLNQSSEIIDNNAVFGRQLIFENYPISPPPADLLASVIKKE